MVNHPTMAIINCPECGKSVSDKAVSCPGCGNPLRRAEPQQVTIRDNTSFFGMGSGTGCLVVVGIIFAILLLGTCANRH